MCFPEDFQFLSLKFKNMHFQNIIIFSGFVKTKDIESKCDALRDLVPFVQFKKREKQPRRSVTFSDSIAIF